MDLTREINDEQAKLWNGPAGHGWVEVQGTLNQMFKPFEDLLAEAVARGPGSRVLDIGCGTGSTTVAAARALGAKGHCVGIDISEPMLAAARSRAQQEGVPVRFIRADAQTHVFEPPGFDTLISRFGVMLFDDPVAAFTNLRRAARDGSGLQFAAWRSAAENPFMTTAERAAAPLLPDIPPRRPDVPGQFAFADQNRVYRILDESGWSEIDIQPLDMPCTFPEQELVSLITQTGPVGRIIREADERTRTQVVEAVRACCDPYIHGAEVRFVAACWMVGARALRAGALQSR